ncbi:3-methyl-2-oxobutanoate hydroxymethyltransferase [Sterolibacterium denitrificans]|uniref:3-methyl-2-oxobutanoate hydroxymethyltransferase n=1 Tax=Sterolibacterium denitrificans TaxID=157592 RepID=A0A7Z7HSY7_9PROT|nr:3-methyl-2-oxobutanoate hydroxymethyltransferase [Sterolibacterium denitrificans]SMB26172.1 3-methyl-2-oxobutanoate hydroxymethyltransferase [Sterolibacterium denitrificans]
MSYLVSDKPVTLHELGTRYAAGEKIATLTAYDASFAALLDRCGIDVILVGDSLGNVLQGHGTTLPVTMEHMIYHTESVARGSKRAFVAADMPWASYQESPAQALRNASRLMAAGAQMVKLEGGAVMAETVRFLSERGIPVWAHIGLTPQSVHALGGYRVQGKGEDAARRMKDDALSLQQAGAAMLLIEMIPATLGAELTQLLKIPTIGIGAGPGCSGQVLVLHDMLGIYPGKTARFVRNFLQGAESIDAAVRAYVGAVKDGSFPAPEHTY